MSKYSTPPVLNAVKAVFHHRCAVSESPAASVITRAALASDVTVPVSTVGPVVMPETANDPTMDPVSPLRSEAVAPEMLKSLFALFG